MKLKREPKANYPILNICKEYSDEDHLLNADKILKYLSKDYGINVGKDAVQDSLKVLMDSGVVLKIRSGSLFYDQRSFTYEDVKKHYIYIQGLSIEQSVKDNIIEKLMHELSMYQRKRLKEELAI